VYVCVCVYVCYPSLNPPPQDLNNNIENSDRNKPPSSLLFFSSPSPLILLHFVPHTATPPFTPTPTPTSTLPLPLFPFSTLNCEFTVLFQAVFVLLFQFLLCSALSLFIPTLSLSLSFSLCLCVAPSVSLVLPLMCLLEGVGQKKGGCLCFPSNGG